MLMMILRRELALLFTDNFSATAKASVDARMLGRFPRLEVLVESRVLAKRKPVRILVESHKFLAFKCEAGLDPNAESRFYVLLHSVVPRPASNGRAGS
jgi:hypothetical protein